MSSRTSDRERNVNPGVLEEQYGDRFGWPLDRNLVTSFDCVSPSKLKTEFASASTFKCTSASAFKWVCELLDKTLLFFFTNSPSGTSSSEDVDILKREGSGEITSAIEDHFSDGNCSVSVSTDGDSSAVSDTCGSDSFGWVCNGCAEGSSISDGCISDSNDDIDIHGCSDGTSWVWEDNFGLS